MPLAVALIVLRRPVTRVLRVERTIKLSWSGEFDPDQGALKKVAK
jgi:hypothetical protein